MVIIVDSQLFLEQTVLRTLGTLSRIGIGNRFPLSVSVVMLVEADIHSESISDVFQLILLLACPVGSQL